MKTFTRILALLLCLSLSIPLFSCGNTEDETTGTPSSEAKTEITTEAATEATPDVARKDYGADFHLLVQPQSNNIHYYWVEESDNDALSEAIYARQQQVYDYLGVDITATQALGHDAYGQPFMTAVKNKDGSIDTLLSHAYMFLSTFVQGGYLLDLQDVDGINLEADHWSLDVMEEVAAGDHLYLGYSDFRLVHTAVITYNKEMLSRYDDALEESIYDTVKNYHWTVDKMISLANLVYVDTTADGRTEDDTFGITGHQWVSFINFVQASNIQLVDMNEQGDYAVSVYNSVNKERTTALVEKISALAKSDSAWFKYCEEPTPLINITSGRTLMSIEYVNSLPQYLSFDVDFGIVPYPMFDEEQANVGYRSLDWGGWLCIPSYTDDLAKVADTLEVLSFYSKDVKITFYEKLLGKQVADAPEDREMLDMVWDSICSDIGLTYSYINTALDLNLYMLPRVTYEHTTEQLASFVAGYEVTANKTLKKFFSSLNKK